MIEPGQQIEVSLRCVDAMEKIDAAAWDACAGPDNPFVGHAFLLAMEQSGSATADTGWAPYHLLAEDGDGNLLACAPLYLKSHSYGEYVFDWGWADAWQRAGKRYYPKLQCAVPFTPATGPRLMVHPDWRGFGLAGELGDAMVRIAERARLSSIHVTFPPEEEAKGLADQGWLLRMGEQYHWSNRGYETFDDFLGALSSRKRKTLRKEREQANAQGVVIRALQGDDIKARHWDAFYRFYLGTVEKKWGRAYLTREFFARLSAAMGEKVVLIMGEYEGRPVAGALNLLGRDTLYGRNWGALAEIPFLHFEMCYYRAIDFAIANRLARVEAGAQGEHKVSRGYLPTATWSAHWVREEPFRGAVARFLAAEREAVAESIRLGAAEGPYRQECE